MNKKKPWTDILFTVEKFHPLPLLVTCILMYLIMININSDSSLFEKITFLIPAGSIYFIAIAFESWRIAQESMQQEKRRRTNSQT